MVFAKDIMADTTEAPATSAEENTAKMATQFREAEACNEDLEHLNKVNLRCMLGDNFWTSYK